MTIEEVIHESVVALFSNEILRRTLVLKGGSALFLTQNINTRLSTDIDFSVSSEIENPDQYFAYIGNALSEHFSTLGFEVFDTVFRKKPKERMESKPKFWAGWCFEFKLISAKLSSRDIEFKQRAALIPDGAAASRIEIEISEYEYCDSTEKVELDGSVVTCYSTALLVLEKLRAICQQHPLYPHGKLKNRARDYFDIYQLVKKYRSTELYAELRHHLPQVFAAKDVSPELIKGIFEPEFVEFQASHFASVEAAVKKETIEPFGFYLEQLRLLVSDLGYLQERSA
ncbi:MAG: nucleotidyl transferase AbiEii/AbiGii toxin family protein [Gammaproteobacteria bacterium]|nr:nucleotidyl transferase AbiEii/AbiGii toxin family protein [Gammaproteobacteria bacterium]